MTDHDEHRSPDELGPGGASDRIASRLGSGTGGQEGAGPLRWSAAETLARALGTTDMDATRREQRTSMEPG